jgi:hypothetical protein|tara:strand:- start:721 stop:1071 length:351 start_codon:yes stop_codon:yes gene_type:complete
LKKLFTIFLLFIFATPALAAGAGDIALTNSIAGFTALTIFVIAYLLVIGEDFIHLRKSKPVLVAAGIIWLIIGWIYTQHGIPAEAEEAFNHNLLEYAQLLLFLLVAMTYINAIVYC